MHTFESVILAPAFVDTTRKTYWCPLYLQPAVHTDRPTYEVYVYYHRPCVCRTRTRLPVVTPWSRFRRPAVLGESWNFVENVNVYTSIISTYRHMHALLVFISYL